MTVTKTTRQGHNARVTLKMSGMLWVIDFGDWNIVGKVPGESDGELTRREPLISHATLLQISFDSPSRMYQ
jgi:hypothetical protein